MGLPIHGSPESSEPKDNHASTDDRILEGVYAVAFAGNAAFIGGLALQSEYFHNRLAVGGMLLADTTMVVMKIMGAMKRTE